MREKKIENALNEFCKNPHWKEKYDNAPSESCKRYVALGFYYSDNMGDIPDYEEYKAERDELEKSFKKADWQHLYKYEGTNPRKAYYKKNMESAEE